MSSPAKSHVVEISPNDKRTYRHLTLGNRLDVLLVHDIETEKSSACVDVRVGSMADPAEMPGLAHFLEHMLFLGTESYPVENEYSSFLNSHGGMSNAYTDQENTVYYFDVQNSAFEEALNMFSSFFTCPLFSETATARETNAVDSENQKNLQSDQWRHYQLMKSCARGDHPFCSFSTGNADTLMKIPESLGLNPRDVVIEFYKKYYSSNIMKLAVYGNDSLDVMQKWVEEKFSAIPDKSLTSPRFPSDPYRPEQLAKLLQVVPVRDSKNLDIYFPTPAVEHLYLTKPTRCLSHLVGHESAGSILSALKVKGWANGLGCFMFQSYTDFSCFAVNVELTDEGVNHTDDVVACIFAYIGMLLKAGPAEWIVQETKEIAEMNFRFVDKIDAASYTTRLANSMQNTSPEHIVSGSELIFSIDTQASWDLLKFFTPENSFVVVKHKGFTGKTTLKEKWYGTEYNEFSLAKDTQIDRWRKCLQGESEWADLVFLPLQNPFVPTDFTIKTNGLSAAAAADISISAVAQTEGASEAAISPVEARTMPDLIDYVTTVSDDANDTAEEESVTPPTGDIPSSTPADAADTTEAAVDQAPAAATAEASENAEEEEEEEEEGEEGPAGQLPPPQGKVLSTWFLQDSTWKVPKVNVMISLEALQSLTSPTGVALTEVFCSCLKEVLSEFSYYADCAGLQYDVKLAKGGVELMFFGYHHKLPVLVGKVLAEMKKMCGEEPCPSDCFSRVKEKVLRSYYNYRFWQPYYHCLLGFATCLEDPRWSSEEKYTALASSSLADFHSFSAQLVRSMKAEVFVHGNTTAEEAKALSASIVSALEFLPLSSSQEPLRRVVSLPKGKEYIYRQHSKTMNPKEPNSAVEMFLPVGDLEGYHADMDTRESSKIGTESLLELMAHIISEPAFDQLRTKEQLGYIVHTATKKVGHLCGLQVIVQSSHKDPSYLDARIEDFLVGFRVKLGAFTDEELQTNIQAVVEKLLEKPKNLDQESSRYWEEIKSASYLFDRKARLAKYLRSVTLKECLEYFDQYFAVGGSDRRKCSSQFYGKGTKYPKPSSDPKVVIIKDSSHFKRTMSLEPIRSYLPELKR